MKTHQLRFIALLSMSVAAGACVTANQHRVSGGPGVTVIYVDHEPPEPRAETATPRRNADEVWIAGHWSAGTKNDYVWTSGHWALPDPGKKEWQEGKWEHAEHGWRYTEGSWR